MSFPTAQLGNQRERIIVTAAKNRAASRGLCQDRAAGSFPWVYSLFLAIAVSVSLVGASLAADQQVIQFNQDDPLGLSMGWDSQSSKKTQATCILFKTSDPNPFPGQDVSFQSSRVTDKYGLMVAIEMSASEKIDAIVGKAEGKAKFAASVNFNGTFDQFAVHGVVRNAATSSNSPDPHKGNPKYPNAIVLADAYAGMAVNNPAQFRTACGDGFVSTITSGAELFGIVTFEQTDLATSAQLEATFSESGGGQAFIEGAQGQMKAYDQSAKLSVSYSQQGGSGAKIATDREGLVQTAQDLANAAKSAPYPFQFVITPYSTLVNWPANVPSGPSQPRPMDLLASVYGAYESVFKTMQYSLDHQDGFLWNRGTSVQTVQNTQDEVQGILKKLSDQANQCASGGSCDVPSDVKVGGEYKYRAMLPLPFSDPKVRAEGWLSADGLRSRVRAYWVEAARSARCGMATSDVSCISNADLTTYANAIPTTPMSVTPVGSYSASCSSCSLANEVLSCQCKDRARHPRQSKSEQSTFDISKSTCWDTRLDGKLANLNARLVCEGTNTQ